MGQKQPLTPERRAALVEGYAAGLSSNDLARDYGITRQRVGQILAAAGVPIRPPGRRRTGRSAFSAAVDRQRDRVIALYREGFSVRSIAATESLSEAYVYDVLALRQEPRRAPAYKASAVAGRRFGRLTVLGPAEPAAVTHWRCRCDCGAERTVAASSLLRGASRSCGRRGCRGRPPAPGAADGVSCADTPHAGGTP